MRVRSFVILGLLLAGLFSTVGPAGGAWPALTAQTTRDEYVIWKSDGTKAVTGKARGYVSTTDSTDSGNQAQLAFNAAGGCSCWVWPDTMRNGNKLRSARYDLYWNDSLVVSSLFIKGNREAAGAVDDTATAANSVSTTDIQNLAVTAAKIDSGVVAGYHVEDGTLTGADIASTSNLSVNSITVADSLHVENITVIGDSLSTGLLIVSQQLDTPDIRCLGCDSIKVNQLTHFEQGIQVEDTLTARTQGATGGVIGIEAGDDPPTRAFLINSGYGADYTVDVVSPTFPGAITTGNAANAGAFIVYDGSSNYTTIQQPSSSSNWLIKLPATFTDGQFLKAAVSGTTITLSTADPLASEKWEWAGQKTYSENTNTWQYFVISGMNAPECLDPSTDASWPVLITPAYFAGLEKRFTGYVSHDTLTVQVVSAFTQDWVLNIHIRESD